MRLDNRIGVTRAMLLRKRRRGWTTSSAAGDRLPGLIRLRLAFGILLIFVMPLSSRAGDLDPRTFLKDYRAALGRLQDAYKTVRVEGILSKNSTRAGAFQPFREEIFDYSYAARDGRERMVATSKKPEYHRAFVTGDCRNFVVYRRPGRGEYAVEQLGPLPPTYQGLFESRRDLFVRAAYSASGLVTKLLGSSGFVVRKLERSSLDGEELLRVEFTRRPDPEHDDPDDVAGWLLLDTARGWAMRSFEVRRISPKASGKAEIRSGSASYRYEAGLPLPADVSLSVKDIGDTVMRWHFQAKQGTFQPTPPAEFTLAGYGLGDLERPARRGGNAFAYWAFGIAGVAIVASVVLRRLGKG